MSEGNKNDDYEPIKRYLDKKLRIGKLDSALLFISSSLGLFFGFLQWFLSGVQAVIFLIPIWILGWGLPFYVGYIRGALILDSVPERIRGWVYLYAGTFMYSAIAMAHFTGQYLPNPPAFVDVSMTVFFVSLGFLIVSSTKHFIRFMFKICDEVPSTETLVAIKYTRDGAYGCGVGLFIVFTLQARFEPIGLMFVIPLLLLIIYAEYKSRDILERK